MIQTLQLGNMTFPVNLVQGPLAGISCAPFRRITWQQGRPAFSYTEMMSCKTLIHQPEWSYQRYVAKDPNEGPVCFQLASSNPQELGEAVKIVTAKGADLIDLNCGCPVKKIRRKGMGSALLTDSVLLHQLITAMRNNTHVPISIKIRIDGKDELFNKEIIKVVSDSGLDFITVHGRHWTEHYETACRYEGIQYFVENLKIPVIGNGDVACIDSLKKMTATNCAGVMIGRAGVGQPWLIRQLVAEITQQPFRHPSLDERKTMFLDHVQDLITLIGSEKFALLQARTFAKYYARGLAQKDAFALSVNQCETFSELEHICLGIFC